MFQKRVYPPVENQLQRSFAQHIIIENTLWKKNFGERAFFCSCAIVLGTIAVAQREGYGMGRLETPVLSSKVANKQYCKLFKNRYL